MPTDAGLAGARRRLRGLRHHPFYCEENAWWLCGEPRIGPGDSHVLFICNRFGHCPFAEQQAAPPGQVVWWDYHVVVLDVDQRIWDLDTRLPLPLPALAWLAGTFPFIDRLPRALEPRFRLIRCSDYRRDFASDRSHMRTVDGRWHHPPPPWSPIGTGTNLHVYRAPIADGPGEPLDWGALHRRLRGG